MALLAWAAGGKRNDSVINAVHRPGRGSDRQLVALVIVLVGLGVASTAYAVTTKLSRTAGTGDSRARLRYLPEP